MKKYIRGWRRRRVSETEGPKGPTGKSPYITPLLRRNASVRRSPVCREVSPTGEARTEGNGGEGGRGDVSWGSRVAIVEAFDEGTRVDVAAVQPNSVSRFVLRGRGASSVVVLCVFLFCLCQSCLCFFRFNGHPSRKLIGGFWTCSGLPGFKAHAWQPSAVGHERDLLS